MTLRSHRTRLALLVLALLAPVAAAESLPVESTVPAAPTVEPVDEPALPDESLDIDEHGLVFQGPATDPTLVRVEAPDGQPALEYAVDAQGRARLDVAGTNAIADATLLTLVGDPTGDAFALYLRDAEGNVHEVKVDRAALASNVELPVDQQVPAVDLLRPPAWPGAPSKPFAIYLQDAQGTHVSASVLDGTPFLQRGGTHKVGLQIPLAEADFHHVYLEAGLTGEDARLAADFAPVRRTDDAAVYEASFLPGLLGLADGDEVELQVYYERRVTPAVVERFPEAVVYAYRVDGTGPTVSLVAPATADDFSFSLSWAGADALSGIGGFTVDYREAGAEQWNRWLTKASSTSATFSGDWGKTYEFRAVALDRVGNPSAPAMATTRIATQDGAEADLNDPPSADILSPRAGAVVAGLVTVRWDALDADGTPITSTLELSADNGQTWRVLYSGGATSATWDTTAESDGPGYRLRLTVSDGTQRAADSVGALAVRNVIAPPPPDASEETTPPATPTPPSLPPDAVQPAQGGDAPPASGPADDDEKGIPAPFAGAAILAAAFLARRRQK